MIFRYPSAQPRRGSEILFSGSALTRIDRFSDSFALRCSYRPLELRYELFAQRRGCGPGGLSEIFRGSAVTGFLGHRCRSPKNLTYLKHASERRTNQGCHHGGSTIWNGLEETAVIMLPAVDPLPIALTEPAAEESEGPIPRLL